MSYQPSVYREHGGDKLIVASSGRGHAAGEIEFQSGSRLDIQSGTSVSWATDLEIASGGSLEVQSGGAINIESGGRMVWPVQVLGTADVATPITEFGVTTIVASTTAPTYTLAGPEYAGTLKAIYVESNTSSGTAKINTSTTAVSVGSSGANQLTVDAVHDAVILVATSTAKWRVISNVGSVARATKTT